MNGRFLCACSVLLLAVLSVPACAEDDDLDLARALVEARHFDFARRLYDRVVADASRSERVRDDARYGRALLLKAEALAAGSEVRFAAAVAAVDAFLDAHPASRHVASARRERVRVPLAAVAWARESDRPDTARRYAENACEAADTVAAKAPVLHHRARFERARLAEDPARELEEIAALVDDFRETHAREPDGREAEHLLGEVLWELARRADEAAGLYGIAYSCFAAGLADPVREPGHLERVARAYRFLAELALEAAPRLPDHELREAALDTLGRMPDAHPAVIRTEDGSLAWIAWSRLLCRVGAVSRAQEVAEALSEHAPSRARQVQLDCLGAHPEFAPSPELLLRLADHLYALAEYRSVIELCRRVIAVTPERADAFVAWRWPAWQRMARAYHALGDRLGEALAYEPIHEAWRFGWIPHDRWNPSDPNLVRAGRDRHRAQQAVASVAERTRGRTFPGYYRSIRDGFLRDYPRGPGRGVWNGALHRWREALEMRKAGHPDWAARLEEAYALFVTVSEDPRAQHQDSAWVYRIRARWIGERYEDALTEGERAWRWWRSDAARELAERFQTVRHRQAAAQAAAEYWTARALVDLDRHVEAVPKLVGYAERHSRAEEPYPFLALRLLLRAHLHLGNQDAAEQTFASLLDAYPEATLDGTGGAELHAIARRTLESILANDPADRALVDALLANRILVLRIHSASGRIRLPVPRTESVPELRRLLRLLAADEEDPERRTHLLALAKGSDAALALLVGDPDRSTFDPVLYHELANTDPRFRLNLAIVYARSNEPDDEWRARNLVRSLLRSSLSVPEDSDIAVRARALDLELRARGEE